MPYPKEHAARLENPDGFKTFRRQNGKLGDGIDAVFGIGEDGKTKMQAIRFDAARFSPEEARAWLKEHDFSPILFEPAADEKKAKEKTMSEDALLQKTFRNWIAQPVSADRNARRLKVVFSTPDQDLDGDIIEELDAKEYSGVVLWHHDQKQLPPAKMLSIEKKDGKWMGEVEFAEDVTVLVGKDAKAGIPGIPVTSKQLFAWYADGFLKGWSVGVLPTERGKGKDSNRVKGKLVEVSMVPVGSNPKALTMSAEGAPLLTKELLRGLGALPERATVEALATLGWEVSPSALLKSVREKGIPIPEGMELEVEPMEVKDGKVLQARIAGWKVKAKAPPPEDVEPEDAEEATSEEMAGDMTCPECGAKGKGPECPDCGAKMVAEKKDVPAKEEKQSPAEALLQKEGRTLSGKNRERLALLMEALGKSWDELEALLKETAPVEKPRRTEPVHDVVLDQEPALPKAKLKAASLLAKLAVS